MLLAPAIPGVLADSSPDNPNHDIVAAEVRADVDNLYFDVAVAGLIEPPEQDVTQFRIDFGILSPEAAAADADLAKDYIIDYGSSSQAWDYFLYQNLTATGLGSALADQPENGTSSTTFTVPRGQATTLTGSAAPEGGVVTDIRIQYRAEDEVVDEWLLDDLVLPASLEAGTRNLHLTATGNAPFKDRSATEQAPTESEPEVDAVAGGPENAVRFTSDLLERPVTLHDGTASLWFSFTTTTPVLALNAMNVRLNAILPDGSHVALGQREAFATDANPNIFTTPGAPQKVSWSLAFSRNEVPAGAQLEVAISADGLLGMGGQGPGLLYYDSTSFDSLVSLEVTEGQAPTIPITDPPLGQLPFHLQGSSGEMTLEAPQGSTPDPVVATGGADTTMAVWETPPFSDSVTLTAARSDLWISPTTTAELVALNFLDAKVFLVEGGQAELVAQRPESQNDDNANVFTTPGVPQKFSWELALDELTVPAGAHLRLVVEAEALDELAPTAAIVYSGAPSTDSKLVLFSQSVTATVDPASAEVGETVTLTGEIGGGVSPYTYHWTFGDGASTAPQTTNAGTVTDTHSYGTAGTYTPTLVVTDSTGSTGGDTTKVTIFDPDPTVEFTAISANPFLATLGDVEITWSTNVPGDSVVHYGTSPSSLDQTEAVSEEVLDHAVTLTGLTPATTYHYQVETGTETSGVHTFTTPGDFTGDATTVVAVIDTGINPYHQDFRHPDRTAHPATYISGFPAGAPALDLTFDADSYDEAVAADRAVWDSIQGDQLYWIPGTNIIGAIDKGDAAFLNSAADTEPILDDDGHGTWTAGTVNQANPEVLLVAIESTDGAFAWAVEQPWIDVISMSYGVTGLTSAPGFGFSEAAVTGEENGKLMVAAGGNDPSPHFTSRPTADPQVISVGGAHPSQQGEEPVAGKFIDVVSNYTIGGLPSAGSLDGTNTVSGTSFATPNVAGTLSAALLQLRTAAGDTEEGTLDGLVTQPGGSGYLQDGVLTALEMRDAMNRTATYWETTDWSLSFTTPILPAAPWVEMGWGFVGPSLANALAATASGQADPTKSEAARTYMETQHEAQTRYHDPAPEDSLSLLSVPGAETNVVQLDEPIETPHPYPNDADITWQVTVDGAYGLSVHFEDFSMETGWDFVSVEDPSGVVYGTFSLEGSFDFWSPYVPGDTAIIRLTSDSNTVRHGFVVNEVDAPSSLPTTSCQSPCAGLNGELHSTPNQANAQVQRVLP